MGVSGQAKQEKETNERAFGNSPEYTLNELKNLKQERVLSMIVRGIYIGGNNFKIVDSCPISAVYDKTVANAAVKTTIILTR